MTFSQGTTISRFFRTKGFEVIANCAHPSNDIDWGKSAFREYDDYVLLNIQYKDKFLLSNEYTKIRIQKGFGDLFFTDIDVIDNNSLISAFWFTEKLKNMALTLYENSNDQSTNEMKSALESKFYKSFKNFSGTEFTLFIINLNYLTF